MFPRRNPPRKRNAGESDERPQPSDSKEFEGKGRVMSAVKRMQFIQRPDQEYSEEDDFVHPCVPKPVIDSNWSSEDEQEAQRQWNAQRQLWELPSSMLPDYKVAWKLAIKFMRCTPWDIIGVRSRLEFTKASGDDKKLWSSNFVRQFSALIPHPAWTDLPYSSAGYLATALQYAIILRTNDQNRWILDPVNPFTEEFARVIKETPGPWNVRKLHRETRTRCRSKMIAFSQLSMVFKSLEVTVRIPHQPKEDETTVYQLTTEDIGNLTKALDNMHDPRTGHSPMTPAVYYTTAVTPRLGGDPPKADIQVERWHELAMAEEFRARILMQRHSSNPVTAEQAREPSQPPVSRASSIFGGTPRPSTNLLLHASPSPRRSVSVAPSLGSSGGGFAPPAGSSASPSIRGSLRTIQASVPSVSESLRHDASFAPGLSPRIRRGASYGFGRGVRNLQRSVSLAPNTGSDLSGRPAAVASPELGEEFRRGISYRPGGSELADSFATGGRFRVEPSPSLGGRARPTIPPSDSPDSRPGDLSDQSMADLDLGFDLDDGFDLRGFNSDGEAEGPHDETMEDVETGHSPHVSPEPERAPDIPPVTWARVTHIPIGTRMPINERCAWSHRQVVINPAMNDTDDENADGDLTLLGKPESRAPGLIFK
ncbi:hypothetical protein CDV36_009013 [Fusarium kuroshium]|uniref:Uncharacterized protein n=1 Tax=Fusarium kuroshium TaxID=2010991 RepID=A0A3M2S1C1_9HYPO|nr:hypothetical protein CDV36_009013 [Fusarium kuroshium]